MVYSTDRSKAVFPVLVFLFVALWFILRGDLFYVLPCVILFLCFSILLALRLPRLGKRELVWVLFVRLFDSHLFIVFSVSSSSWCLGRAAVCDCGTPRTFHLPLCSVQMPEKTVLYQVDYFLYSSVSFKHRSGLTYIFSDTTM